jgi:hypothetical protein
MQISTKTDDIEEGLVTRLGVIWDTNLSPEMVLLELRVGQLVQGRFRDNPTKHVCVDISSDLDDWIETLEAIREKLQDN